MREIWSYRATVVTEPTVSGYRVEATDGNIGNVEQSIHDEGQSYLVVTKDVDGRGGKVLLPAGVVERIDHEDRVVHIVRTSSEVEAAPAYDDEADGGEAYLEPFGDYYWGAFGTTAE